MVRGLHKKRVAVRATVERCVGAARVGNARERERVQVGGQFTTITDRRRTRTPVLIDF